MATNAQTDALLEYYATLGAQQPGKDALTRNQRNIDFLRKTSAAPAGGYTETAGGQPPIFVAPHPLQGLASIAGQGMAGYQQSEADAASEQYGKDANKANAELIRQLRAIRAGAPATGAADAGWPQQGLPGIPF